MENAHYRKCHLLPMTLFDTTNCIRHNLASAAEVAVPTSLQQEKLKINLSISSFYRNKLVFVVLFFPCKCWDYYCFLSLLLFVCFRFDSFTVRTLLSKSQQKKTQTTNNFIVNLYKIIAINSFAWRRYCLFSRSRLHQKPTFSRNGA